MHLDASNTVVEADETDNTSTISFSTSAPTTLPQKLLWPLAEEQASPYAL